MKVLLINPPVCPRDDSPIFVSEPLAFACLEPIVSRRGHIVEVFDPLAEAIDVMTSHRNGFRQGLTNEQINIRLKDYSPDVIGITCPFTEHFNDAAEVAEICKSNFPNVPVIIGGTHATMHHSEVIEEFPAFDYAVRGEGEETFVKLLDTINNDLSPEGILGVTYRDGNQVVVNPYPSLIKDLDLLPMPNRKILKMKTYFDHKKKYGLKMGGNVATVITSRGCPYECTFCNVKDIWGGREGDGSSGRNWRIFSVERVIKELVELYHDFGVREVSISDEQFALRPKRVHELMDAIIQKKLKGLYFTISSGLSVWFADIELLQKMKDAGMYRVRFPLETGSPDILKYMKKTMINLDEAKKLISAAVRMGLWTEGNFILGTPYETKKNIEETKDYILSSDIDFPYVFMALSLPGTSMTKDAGNEGLIALSPSYYEIAYTSPPGSLVHTVEELKAFQGEILKAFLKKQSLMLLNPIKTFIYLYPRVNSISGLKYFLRMAMSTVVTIWGDFKKDQRGPAKVTAAVNHLPHRNSTPVLLERVMSYFGNTR